MITDIAGIIRRRILMNYAADPAVVQPLLPTPFRPKLQAGKAVVGVCLIRLEQVRPAWLPAGAGLASENAAHRFAVEWTAPGGEACEGVYISRRDTDSRLSHLAGGRLFPGQYRLAQFDINDAGDSIDFHLATQDKSACLHATFHGAQALPEGSIFPSTAAASQFFEKGCDGYSPRDGAPAIDGMRLCIDNWSASPLHVEQAQSAYFDDLSRFPAGSIRLDHALLMRDVPHHWEKITDSTV